MGDAPDLRSLAQAATTNGPPTTKRTLLDGSYVAVPGADLLDLLDKADRLAEAERFIAAAESELAPIVERVEQLQTRAEAAEAELARYKGGKRPPRLSEEVRQQRRGDYTPLDFLGGMPNMAADIRTMVAELEAERDALKEALATTRRTMGEATPVTCVGILPGGALCDQPTEYIVSDLPTCGGCMGNVVKASLRNGLPVVTVFLVTAGATPCPACGGGGNRVNRINELLPCRACNGSGEVTVCPECKGRGWVRIATDPPCSRCGGTGTVPARAREAEPT